MVPRKTWVHKILALSQNLGSICDKSHFRVILLCRVSIIFLKSLARMFKPGNGFSLLLHLN